MTRPKAGLARLRPPRRLGVGLNDGGGVNPGRDSDARQLGEFTDVRELQRRLGERGVELISEADEGSTVPASFTVADPDGNTIPVDQHV